MSAPSAAQMHLSDADTRRRRMGLRPIPSGPGGAQSHVGPT
jgi:hypothetical protein